MPPLKELPRPPSPDQPLQRRWFFGQEMDLVVWAQADGTIAEFQLAYDKSRRERSLGWHPERGFAHYAVDHGTPLSGANESPLLYPHSPCDGDRLLATFEEEGIDLPTDIRTFVTARIREFIAAERARLSTRTWQLIDRLFAPVERPEAAAQLMDRGTTGIPLWPDTSPDGLERLHFAVLKLSDGNLPAMRRALDIAQIDWRDVLVAAGFGHDLGAHRHWAAETLAATVKTETDGV